MVLIKIVLLRGSNVNPNAASRTVETANLKKFHVLINKVT